MTEITEETIKKMQDVARNAPDLLDIYIACELKKQQQKPAKRVMVFFRNIACFLVPWVFFSWVITRTPEIHSWEDCVLYGYAGIGVAYIYEILKKACELFFD